MSVEDQAAAPAGAGVLSAEQPVAGPPIDHSLDGVLAQWRKDQEQEAKEPEGQKPEGDGEPVDQPGDEPEPAADEADKPDGEPSEPDDEQPADFIPGNALTRMQDGSVRPVGELKKAWGELQELKKTQPELATARQQLDADRVALQQRAEQLDQLFAQVGETGIPDAPTDEQWDVDPISAMQQQRRHDAAKAQRDRLKSEQQKRSDEARAAFSAEQGKKLLEINPDLRDTAKAEAFGKEFLETVSAWGFGRQEIDVGGLDHRLVHHAVADHRDAQKWRKLQADKAKAAKKAEGAAPVQPAGRRLTPGENRDSQVEALRKRAQQSGQIDDVLAYHRALEAG